MDVACRKLLRKVVGPLAWSRPWHEDLPAWNEKTGYGPTIVWILIGGSDCTLGIYRWNGGSNQLCNGHP